MILSLADNSSNGYIVKSIDPNGVIGNDGRIHIGDYIVTLNGKSLRGLSKTDVLAILNDCEQQCKNDDIMYVLNIQTHTHTHTHTLYTSLKNILLINNPAIFSLSFPLSLEYSFRFKLILLLALILYLYFYLFPNSFFNPILSKFNQIKTNQIKLDFFSCYSIIFSLFLTHYICNYYL